MLYEEKKIPHSVARIAEDIAAEQIRQNRIISSCLMISIIINIILLIRNICGNE